MIEANAACILLVAGPWFGSKGSFSSSFGTSYTLIIEDPEFWSL